MQRQYFYTVQPLVDGCPFFTKTKSINGVGRSVAMAVKEMKYTGYDDCGGVRNDKGGDAEATAIVVIQVVGGVMVATVAITAEVVAIVVVLLGYS